MTLPLEWDPRLDAMGVQLVRTQPAADETCYRLVKAKWFDEAESGGRHHIYVDVLDEGGKRIIGQRVMVAYDGQTVVLVTEDKPYPELSCNMAMYAVLGTYRCQVEGVSDVVTELGMGSAELPGYKLHTCFELTFQREKAGPPPPPDGKFDFHYVLLGQTVESIVPWAWMEALRSYLERFRVTLGFSHDHSMMADNTKSRHVTIIGSPDASVAVSEEAERIIRASGAEVDRVPGTTAAQIKAEMDRRAATGKRFG
ncbi:MAG: hypothetical protein E3J21_26570 [Anaerolineales bacterium]|nr:MAG: hypothetical protein E3J21_26570 [Anaerolineales bacterium]